MKYELDQGGLSPPELIIDTTCRRFQLLIRLIYKTTHYLTFFCVMVRNLNSSQGDLPPAGSRKCFKSEMNLRREGLFLH